MGELDGESGERRGGAGIHKRRGATETMRWACLGISMDGDRIMGWAWGSRRSSEHADADMKSRGTQRVRLGRGEGWPEERDGMCRKRNGWHLLR